MGIHGVNHRAERSEEDGVLVRVLARVQEVGLAVVYRPVVMLAGTVDAGKRLFVQQAHEAMTVGDLAEHFHNLHVVVAGEVHFLEHRGKFKLCRSDFVVAGLRRNAELPEFLFHVVHKVQDAGRNATKVMVFHLLVLCRSCTEQCAAGLVQVRALQVETLVDEEVFLFCAEGDGDLLLGHAEHTHEAVGGLLQGLNGAEQRSLLVQRFAGVAAKRGGNAERGTVTVTLDECGGGGVPGGVATGFEGGTQAAAGEAGRVRFAHN